MRRARIWLMEASRSGSSVATAARRRSASTRSSAARWWSASGIGQTHSSVGCESLGREQVAVLAQHLSRADRSLH
jgi:hypothetical protein